MRITIRNTVLDLPDEIALSLIRDGVALPFQKTIHDRRESYGQAMLHSQALATANKQRKSSKD